MNEEAKELAAVVATAVAGAIQQTGPKSDIPWTLKWAAGIAAALLVAAISGSGAWLINTVSGINDTVIEMNTRAEGEQALNASKDADTTRRIEALESYHRRVLE
jgi:hypothetical protein